MGLKVLEGGVGKVKPSFFGQKRIASAQKNCGRNTSGVIFQVLRGMMGEVEGILLVFCGHYFDTN